MENDGLFQVSGNNIGISKMGKYALTVALDIKTTSEFGIDVMALRETRRPWTPENRRQYDTQCKLMFPHEVQKCVLLSTMEIQRE
jgi:hypothetical protein